MGRGAIAWSVFEGARNPYVILVNIYPVCGQAVISQGSRYAGWIITAAGPFLVASLNKLGPRKAWLALVMAGMIPMMVALWWAKPDGMNAILIYACVYAVGVMKWRAPEMLVYGIPLGGGPDRPGIRARRRADPRSLTNHPGARTARAGFTGR